MSGEARGMRIHVDFTIEVPADALPALRELAAAEDNVTARLFFAYDAHDYLIGYLTSNGIPARLVREKVGGQVIRHE